MKIRIEGTAPELDAAVDRLRREFFIQSVSRPYRNRNSELSRVYVEAELPAENEYKTIIRLKDGVSEDLLRDLTDTIEKAFVNREGSLQNVSDKPCEFVFQGDESYYGCLDLGMLALREVPGFLDFVQAWAWVDVDPDECCNMLEVFANEDRRVAEISGTAYLADPELTPSYRGKKCLGNGEHPGIECCCDECDHLQTCFPD